MKLIDFTKKGAQKGSFQETLSNFKEQLPFLGKSDAQRQQEILMHFQRGLDNRYTMVQNFVPEGSVRPIPFILIGPVGVALLNLNMEKGVYRIKEETWHELNKSTRKFGLARVNLVKQTQTIAQTISAFLTQKGQTVAEVIPVLIFADAGVHIDQTRPAIRLVLADGIDRLIASLVQANETLSPVDVKAISDIFDNLAHPVTPIDAKEEDFFGKDLGLGVEKPKPKVPRPAPEINLPPALKQRLKFTRGQWVLLGAFLILNILLLMGVILLVVFTAG